MPTPRDVPFRCRRRFGCTLAWAVFHDPTILVAPRRGGWWQRYLEMGKLRRLIGACLRLDTSIPLGVPHRSNDIPQTPSSHQRRTMGLNRFDIHSQSRCRVLIRLSFGDRLNVFRGHGVTEGPQTSSENRPTPYVLSPPRIKALSGLYRFHGRPGGSFRFQHIP